MVDDAGRPTAISQIGEIVVQSRYLALGYWRNAELTAARFRPGPGGTRRYLSGDLGRRRADGAIELLGRKDLQVRLHGEWVDTSAIEAALLALGPVREAAVAVRELRAGRPELVAYLVPAADPPPNTAALRAALAERHRGLPWPTRWHFVNSMPRDANGKLDRARLPDPGPATPAAASNGSDAAWGRGSDHPGQLARGARAGRGSASTTRSHPWAGNPLPPSSWLCSWRSGWVSRCRPTRSMPRRPWRGWPGTCPHRPRQTPCASRASPTGDRCRRISHLADLYVDRVIRGEMPGQRLVLDHVAMDAVEQEQGPTMAARGQRDETAAAPSCGADRGGLLFYRELAARAYRVAHAIMALRGDREEPMALAPRQGPELIGGDPRHAGRRQGLSAARPGPSAGAQPARPGRLRSVAAARRSRHERTARPGCRGGKVLDLGGLDPDLPCSDPRLELDPTASAYIFYTSGSTGRPKGVATATATCSTT